MTVRPTIVSIVQPPDETHLPLCVDHHDRQFHALLRPGIPSFYETETA